jgi:hypothetical protein
MRYICARNQPRLGMTENRHIRRRVLWERSRARAPFRLALPHLFVALFGLLAVALQSFVVQTHIHVQQPAYRTQAVSLITLAAASIVGADLAAGQTGAPVDNYPVNRDPANCPLCKELTHSGQYVSSASVLATLPFPVTVNVIVFREIAPSLFAASHTWRGRAPPLA